METLLLGPTAVSESVELETVIEAVEAAFGADARGDAQMPAKSYIDLPQYDGDFRSMPAHVDTGEWEAAGVKWVNSHAENPRRHGLPTVMGTMVYSDPETAVPLALLDGTTLTRLRTGAAAAVATRHLAPTDASSLGLVGAGVQSHTQLEAIAQVRDIRTVVVTDVDEAAVETFQARFDPAFDVRAGSVEQAATCDVVSTTTPVREPVVERVGESTHVNAMGADAAGKQELRGEILRDGTLVVDDREQCIHSGEMNVPYSEGLLTEDDIHADLGDVVTDRLSDPPDPDDVTVFDSTGLAIQDIAAAHAVYERATAEGRGTPFELVATDD
jgi:alanine dehydrogenase